MLYFKNKEGNKMIGVENGIVTEFDLLFTGPVEGFAEEDTLVVEPVKTVTFTNVKTPTTKKTVKSQPKKGMSEEERREHHKAYMVEYNKKYKEKQKAKMEKKNPPQVDYEPNLKLIQEFGRSTIDQMIICKRQGMTAEEVDDDKPVHCGHLVFGQIERILDTVKW